MAKYPFAASLFSGRRFPRAGASRLSRLCRRCSDHISGASDIDEPLGIRFTTNDPQTMPTLQKLSPLMSLRTNLEPTVSIVCCYKTF